MAKRRITDEDGLRALAAVRSGSSERTDVATTVRFLLEELAAIAPGKTVEMRVPPFGAVQCIGGLTHTRGTPPNVIETDAETWIGLATGTLEWGNAVSSGRVIASGSRADLASLLPIYRVRH
ncbi:MAG: sterol carrier family protein [Leucobacter sp.]